MQRMMTGLSVALMGLLGVFLILFGALYMSVDQMLPFHAAAAPEETRAAVLPLYRALMALIGGASIGLGVLGLYVTFGSMRKSSFWAAIAVGIAYAIAIFAAAMVAERLRHETGAPTTWHIMGVLLLIDAIALVAAWVGARKVM